MNEFQNLYGTILQNPNLLEPQKSQICYLGNSICQTNLNDISIQDDILNRLILLYPDEVSLYLKLGNVFKHVNTFRAITLYKIGYQIDPTHVENTVQLCKTLFENGMTQMVFHLNKNNLFEKFMDNSEFLSTYSRCNFQQLYYKNGVSYLLKLIKKNASKVCVLPEDRLEKWKNYHDIGYVFCAMGEIEKAIQYTEKAVDLANKFNLDLKSKLLSFSNSLCFADFGYANNDAMYKKYAKINDYLPPKPVPYKFGWKNKKIRIGYLSSDYVYHSVANFILPILKYHDRSKFEIVLFSNVEHIENMFTTLKNTECYIIANKSTEEASNFIYGKKIDILIELNGHTVSNRLDIMAWRPAPIQITYLGYPNSTGIRDIQYRITDAYADPPESTQKYSEVLLKLPKCFLLFSSVSQNIPTVPRKTKDTIILGAINKENKNSRHCMDTWKAILKECPNTKILIKLETFDNNEERMEFYTRHLDCEQNQIIILNKLSNEQYNRVFTMVDILLDPFPYSGTTTTCNSLYNSVPVVSLYHKDYHAHNVSASILINSELPELVAYSTDQYVNIVKQLVQNPGRIEDYKKNIHQKFMKAMNPENFMKDYEQLLQGVYEKPVTKQKDVPKKEVIEIRLDDEDEDDYPKHAPKNNELLFICVFDYGSAELGVNHIQSLQNNNITNYMSFALDKRCYDMIKERGFKVTLVDDIENHAFFNNKKEFGRPDFTETSFYRYKIIHEQLKTHKAVWYMDVDTVVLQDLNRYYTQYKGKNYDMVYQNDIHQITRCTGCVLYFSNPKTIEATLHIYRGKNNQIPDQHFTHYFLEQNRNSFNTTLFETTEFPNGLLFFDLDDLISVEPQFMEMKKKYETTPNKKTAFVHANWMVGNENKIRVLKKKGLWFVGPR